MGDVAMTAPVLRAVTKAYPELRIIMLTKDFYEPFFEGIDNLTIHNIDLAEQHRGVMGIHKLYHELLGIYKIDLIVDLNDKLYSKLLRWHFWRSGVPSFHIDKGRKEKKALTERHNKVLVQLRTSVARYGDVFAAAGYPVAVDDSLVRQAAPIPQIVDAKNERWIGIAPFAKHIGKVLPLPTVRKLIELIHVREPETRIFIFGGGSAERMVAQSIVSWYPWCTSVIGKVTLEQELNLMSNLDVMVSMDSSAMHMCSLVGTPVVSVWGATHPYAGFLGLGQSADRVVEVPLECRPCSVYGHKPCWRGDYACLHNITAEQVYQKINI